MLPFIAMNAPDRPVDDRLAAELRGFGPIGIAAVLVVVLIGNGTVGPMIPLPLGGALALLWVRLSRTPWREIGYVRPRSWALTIVLGIVLGFAFKVVMKAIVMPLLGADPVNQSYHFLAGNRALLPGAIAAMFAAGFAEETVFRGFLFERLGKLFGSSTAAKIGIVIGTSILFGAAHLQSQGLPGAEQATVTGLTFGTIFMITRSIALPMIAHTAFDLTALAMIYLDLETRFAHLIFK
jgi:membrane protease YdiL (CAAX protease family)